MGMMLCTFFFARLWRRAKLITDVEYNELRYGGKPAAGLRIFHATFRSLIQNQTLIIQAIESANIPCDILTHPVMVQRLVKHIEGLMKWHLLPKVSEGVLHYL